MFEACLQKPRFNVGVGYFAVPEVSDATTNTQHGRTAWQREANVGNSWVRSCIHRACAYWRAPATKSAVGATYDYRVSDRLCRHDDFEDRTDRFIRRKGVGLLSSSRLVHKKCRGSQGIAVWMSDAAFAVVEVQASVYSGCVMANNRGSGGCEELVRTR